MAKSYKVKGAETHQETICHERWRNEKQLNKQTSKQDENEDEDEDEFQLQGEKSDQKFKKTRRCTGFYLQHCTERLLLFRVGKIEHVLNY